MTAPIAIDLGDLSLSALRDEVDVEGQTTSGADDIGTGRLYEVLGPDGLHLSVRDTQWRGGERDVVACDRHDSPKQFDTLVERLRLGVPDHGDLYVELRQAQVRPNGRAGLFAPDLDVLDHGAGVDVAAALRDAGATSVGTREELLHDAGRHRNRLGALFPRTAAHLPVVAYALTRIAPVLRGVPSRS